MAELELNGLTKRFGDQLAVHDFDLRVPNGALVSFLGPSGCGKTTTLRMTAGFEPPDAGRILVDGVDITGRPPNRRQMGMVFQGYALFPNMTAAGNVDFGLSVQRRAAADRRRRVGELLDLFGLGHVAERYPHQMSGGQQQRVALARAIAVEPHVLLLDEPLSAVDAKVREELRTEIRRMQVQLGITTILVTHDQSEALSISDIVVVMNRGRIEETGTPSQIYAEPRSAFTAEFIGAMNEIPVHVVDARRGVVLLDGTTFTAPVGASLEGHDRALLLVRPELLEPLDEAPAAPALSTTAAAGPVLRGRVQVRTFLGATTRLLLEALPGVLGEPPAVDHLAVDVPSASAARWPVGAEITLRVPPGAARLVPAAGRRVAPSIH